MANKKSKMSDGDAKAWEHAIASGRLGPMDDDERENLALMACYTAEQVDGREGLPESEMDTLMEWASKTRIAAVLLDGVLTGQMYVRVGTDGEPSFSLTPKGEESARETAMRLGLPVGDKA